MTERLEIPFDRLSAEALRGLIEEFVSREGTDYGAGAPATFESKVAEVRRQLESGEAVILFDAGEGTTNIVLRRDLQG